MRSLFRLFTRARASAKPSKPHSPSVKIIATTMATGSVTAALYAATFSSPVTSNTAPEDAKNLSHHNKHGKGFINPWDSWLEVAPWKLGYEMISRRIKGTANVPDTTPPTVPVVKPNFLPSRFGHDALRATWLGHACYYVEFPSGLRVLFDPVFESRCSPFSFMGPKRFTERPCNIKDIPIVDLVVISHSHYDHLSHPTITEIQQRHPNVLFAVPLGLNKWFNDSGVKNVVELDWWQDIDVTFNPITNHKTVSASSNTPFNAGPSSPPSSTEVITARISCLPCQHTSARTLWDKNHTLWASWAVASAGKSVWFGGDTGYRGVPKLPDGHDDYAPEYAHLPRCPAFKEIGERKGPFDLGMIPIGAYDPRWIFSSMHANPFDSVEIFKDTKCKKAMGIHWGTWVLTEEDVWAPPALLRQALKRSNIQEQGVFDVCDIGVSREF